MAFSDPCYEKNHETDELRDHEPHPFLRLDNRAEIEATRERDNTEQGDPHEDFIAHHLSRCP